MWVGGIQMKKILTGLQAICGIFGTLGTVGEMD